MVPCVEDTSDIPQVTFNFVSIADIENVAADKIIGNTSESYEGIW